MARFNTIKDIQAGQIILLNAIDTKGKINTKKIEEKFDWLVANESIEAALIYSRQVRMAIEFFVRNKC